MGLLQVVSDNVAIFLVALVVLLAVILFIASKLMDPKSEQGTADPGSLDQSPAAKAFRKNLQEISLDLDKD
ncbi:hypothetical protein OURE66S_01889 [Oligella ureolytica]